MHLIRSIFIIGITLIPLICSTKVSLGDGFFLPSLKNIESQVDNLWTNFKKGYGIKYNTTEEVQRFKIFANNMKMIIKHNLEHDLGLHTYRLGINKYATLVNRGVFFLSRRFCSFFLFRQIKNFVKNLMDIDAIKILVCVILIFVVYMFQQHLI
jgi:hypothetical protein